MALPWKGEYCFLPGMGMVSGAHLGYLDRGVFPVRKAVLLAKGLVLLCDACLLYTSDCDQILLIRLPCPLRKPASQQSGDDQAAHQSKGNDTNTHGE